MSNFVDRKGNEAEFNPFKTEPNCFENAICVMGSSSIYSHLFDNDCSLKDFDSLILDVNDDNKHVVIPLLLNLAEKEQQVLEVHEICDRVNFDLSGL